MASAERRGMKGRRYSSRGPLNLEDAGASLREKAYELILLAWWRRRFSPAHPLTPPRRGSTRRPLRQC